MLFPDFSCRHRRMCVHARCIAWQQKQLIGSWVKKGYNILSLTKKRRSEVFLSTFEGKVICFNYKIVWQLFHRRLPVLCLNISTLLLFCAFSKLTPKIKPLKKLYRQIRNTSLFENGTVLLDHFTVVDGSEAEGDLVLIQTFLLYYVNQVILMLTSIFQEQFP